MLCKSQLLDSLPDSRDITQPALCDDFAKILLHGLQGAGSTKISPYPKGFSPLTSIIVPMRSKLTMSFYPNALIMKDFPGKSKKRTSGLFEAKFSFGQAGSQAFHLGEQFSFKLNGSSKPTIMIAQLVGILLQVIEPGTVKA